MEVHWGSFLAGAAAGAVAINAFAGEIGKALSVAFIGWVRRQRRRFLSGDQKRLLWLAEVGGGGLVVNLRRPGSPEIFSPQRGKVFPVRGKLQPLVDWGLLDPIQCLTPSLIEYRLTEQGAERVERLPDFEDEFPSTEVQPEEVPK